MGRLRTLEGRLLGWLIALALLPTMLVLAAGLGLGTRSLEWLGTLGPWARVAESGRVLLEETEASADQDPALRAAVERHRAELSESLVQARRWSYIGQRVSSIAPMAVLLVALLLATIAWAVSRRLARQLARPIRDLVGWSEQLAANEPLPGPARNEASEVAEVETLRGALRTASARILESRRRELEAARLRAWAEMARRVAHEMKNPLTPLRLAAHRLSSLEDRDAAMAMEVIREETGRLEQLAAEFAALGRPPEGPASAVDLEEMLGRLLASDVPASIRSTLHVQPGTSTVEAYYEALLRAFRNLLRNAVDAVAAEGGVIELSVASEDGGVRVTIADNGPGVPDGLAERIFEPDFTRKPGGTGLGLAVVRQTVAAHGGQVSARTGERGGAEFIVWLPASPRRASTNGAR